MQCNETTYLTRVQKRGTVSFTSLRLSLCGERPEAISLLLQWPAKLTRFVFGEPYLNPYHLSPAMAENCLLLHQNSITHIDLGSLYSDPDTRIFNATLFPNLEFYGYRDGK
jgi:hypothetical protein